MGHVTLSESIVFFFFFKKSVNIQWEILVASYFSTFILLDRLRQLWMLGEAFNTL